MKSILAALCCLLLSTAIATAGSPTYRRPESPMSAPTAAEQRLPAVTQTTQKHWQPRPTAGPRLSLAPGIDLSAEATWFGKRALSITVTWSF